MIMVYDNLDEMLKYLITIRKDLNVRKEAKLMDKWDELGDFRQYSFDGCYHHFLLEGNELIDAIKSNNAEKVRIEIIDCINILEMMYALLMGRSYIE